MSMATGLDLESLRLLVLVGCRGSLTAAAAEMGLNQPAASKRMSALERKLGLRLLDRSRRGSALTPAGVLVQTFAQQVLDGVARLVEGVETIHETDEPRLRVAASQTIAEHLLPAWIGQLRDTDPHVRVGLQVLNSRRVCELARGHDIDLGFIESPGAPAGLRSRVVAFDRLMLVVPPAHRWLSRRRPVDAVELADTPLISREPGSGTRETGTEAVRRQGMQVAPPLLELGSSTAVCNAVAAGSGPALVSELAAAAMVAAGRIVQVPVRGVDLRRQLRAVWRSGTTPSGVAAHLLTRADACRTAARSGQSARPEVTAAIGIGTPAFIGTPKRCGPRRGSTPRHARPERGG